MIPQFYEGYPQIYVDDKLWVNDDKKMEFKELIDLINKEKQDEKRSCKLKER